MAPLLSLRVPKNPVRRLARRTGAAGPLAGEPGAGGGWPARRRRWVAGGGAALVLAAAALALILTGGGDGSESATAPKGPLARVERRDLTSSTSADGTLGYRGRDAVVCRLSGTVTWLPGAGRLIGRGEVLLEVDERPVVLFYGSTPAYRTLSNGVADGEDVRQLEENLSALGFDPYGAMSVDDEFTDATEAAVERWQDAVGLKQTGEVELGRVVFLPGAQRISGLETELGAAIGSAGGDGGSGGEGSGDPAAGGAPDGDADSGSSSTTVMQTTSTRRGVTAELDVSDQSLAKIGAKVTVRLPDGSTAKGRVTRISKVASEAGDAGDDESSGEATIAVSVELLEARDKVDRYDQAPVSVTFTEVVRQDVLAVPVSAIVALPGGGYAVNAVTAGGVRSIPVETGTFANGYVEISGDGIRPGMRVEDAG